MTSINEDKAVFDARVDAFVEHSYGRVMPPYQRDLVKRIAKGEEPTYARPFIRKVCERAAKEVLAVISAGQTP